MVSVDMFTTYLFDIFVFMVSVDMFTTYLFDIFVRCVLVNLCLSSDVEMSCVLIKFERLCSCL